VEIPYSDSRIPSRACVKSYPTREVSGLILFWFHEGGAAPSYEVPEIVPNPATEWIGPFEFRTEFAASLQDMAENNVDYTHFHFVHGREALTSSTSKVTTDGPFSTVTEVFEDSNLVFTRHTYGPGVAHLHVDELMTVLTTTTPIDRRHVRLLWKFFIPAALESAADDIMDGVTGDFGLGADIPIWRDKIFVERPLLVKGDGPISEFRRWYGQFYEGIE
jgi:phenylpropionate dioxygenase-like ring-hydroxylating dioxygenase large terminal subunit